MSLSSARQRRDLQSKHGYPVAVARGRYRHRLRSFRRGIIFFFSDGAPRIQHALSPRSQWSKLVGEAHEQGKSSRRSATRAGCCFGDIVRGKTPPVPQHQGRHGQRRANWVDRGRPDVLVTSRSPAELAAFMRTIIAALKERRGSTAPERQSRCR